MSNCTIGNVPRQSFVNGEGNVVFGNDDVACTVDDEQGECNQFGSCFKLNVNEIDTLADNAPQCIAGGEVRVLNEDGNVVPNWINLNTVIDSCSSPH